MIVDTGVPLYRGMKADPVNPGVPRLGAASLSLGLRADDVSMRNGLCEPGCGGLSVAPRDLDELPPHALPLSLGGRSRHPLWRITVGDVAGDLRVTQDGPGHAVIGTSSTVSFAVFAARIEDTQGSWSRIDV
jgi:hypothetical protein